MASTVTPFAHLQIPLEEVVKATNNFDDEYIIGEGGFGKVYRGQLLVSGAEIVNIAARRLDPKHHRQGSVEFWTEITVLSSLKHDNIVSMIGFCDENGEKIIINKDEATKGSLSMYLSDPTTLTWIQRLKICVGVARALRCIHNGEGGRSDSVIHRNINSSTVLLDAKFEAKLSGFELSIKQPVNRKDQVVISEAIGTKGYMDPSIKKKGGVSHKSDIYSFGVVLCEILCGRKAFIPDHVDDSFLAPLFISHFENGSLNDVIHPDLRPQMSRQSLTWFSREAYSCLNKDRAQRPKMDDIVVAIEKALELENLIQKLEHLKIPLSDITLASDNFSEEYCIRGTNYYDLYIADIEYVDTKNPSIKKQSDSHGSHNKVVIKRYLPAEKALGQDIQKVVAEDVFFTELNMFNICKHPSIVKLLGFCVEGSEMILVVEHLSSGYLATWLRCASKDVNRHIFTWEKRLKICIDVANALNYLHTEMEDQKRVICRNISSYMIALDENWGAKITDLSFSVFLPPNQYHDTLYHRFAFGNIPQYIDPEYKGIGKLKRESDVYSFGVVMCEVLCGRLADDPIYLKENDNGLAYVARRNFQDATLLKEMIDPNLKEESGENLFRRLNKNSLEKFIKTAYNCLAESQDQRPTMKVVIRELQDALSYQIKKLEHLKIPLGDIMLATDNFSMAYMILNAPNQSYSYYKAELKHFVTENSSIMEGKNKSDMCWTCNTVVIKRYLPGKYDNIKKMFFTEIQMLDTCKHPSIAKLLGFCVEGSEMILIVEHLSKEYLSEFWHPRAKETRHYLTWARRLKICLDVANALNYLHTEMEDQKTIIHLDIRSRNIAVDENWGAKIIDFRYSVFLPPNQYNEALYDPPFSTTYEYQDPEYRKTGKVKRESDVYGFGVILFEVLCGRSAYDPIYKKQTEKGLAYVARRCIREGTLTEMIDPLLKEQRGENGFILNIGPNKDSLEKFVKIAHACIAKTQNQRPTMRAVIQELKDALFFQENKDNFIMSFHDIELATENFHNDNCIGKGGFGNVYRGKVPQGDGFNTIVAKRLDTRLGQGEQQFRAELQILFEYKHKNIIPLVGYCDEKDAKIIVYEYASRGSLDRYLKDAHLTWMKRLNICIHVATALAFLHGGAGKQAIVIHRDIKTPNILLNDEWDAKLADFGLSLISPINQETDYVIDHACGTRGYLDPLYLKSGFLTKESDIYSFGVVSSKRALKKENMMTWYLRL
uniref:uncharacterized protein LOC122583743 n=1 Tax=Erigeron canadensis TaxID=72917 RepID=UPI001CB8BF11|nr:uncharacterized protein LOC122583743 [Erigeron canadensis]